MRIPGTINGTFNVGDTVTMPPDAVGIVASVGFNYVNVYATTGPNTFYHYWLADKSRILTGPTGTMSSITDVDPPHCDGFQIHGGATDILIKNNYINREIVVGRGTADGQGFKLAGSPSKIQMENNLVVASTPALISGTSDFNMINNILIGIGHPVYGAEVRVYGGIDTIIDNMYNNIISRLTKGSDPPDGVIWIKNHGNNIFHHTSAGGPAYPFTVNATEIDGMSIASMDAMFVSAHTPNFDYHLAAGATTIDFGDPAHAPATDIEGNLRDALPDAGAYEFQSGHCLGTDSSCGTWPNCQNCNNSDGCSGTSYRDYYCIDNNTGCGYTEKDCSDCSCSCEGYNNTESTTNNNCSDGKDNDCDGLIDLEEASCQEAECMEDSDCPGQICCLATCVDPACTVDADCDDANAETVDTCNAAGTCNAACENTQECVDMPALLNYIGQWKQGQITMLALMGKIALWKTGEGCS